MIFRSIHFLHMKTKLSVLLFLLFLGGLTSFSQDIPAQDTIPQDASVQEEVKPAPVSPPKEKKPIGDKVYFGGYFNMSFGSYTLIGIEPMIGYKLLPRLSVGAKFRYDYMQDKRYAETYTASNYGASVFSRLVLFKGLYAHAEYAGYNYKFYYADGESEREWVPFLLVGGGYTMRVGNRTSVNAQILFDVLQNDKSPYSRYEPFYSVGVGVGF